MRESACDILIVGGGTGGCAAAMAACSMGLRVLMTEETDWIGGQLTAQMVPPDEHRWIEQCGCTARYRRYRELVRQWYRDHRPLNREARGNPWLNPGGGWVSRLCHEPRVGLEVLQAMLAPYIASGLLEIRLRCIPSGADIEAGRVRHIELLDLNTGRKETVPARMFIDATELGDLLPLTNTDYVIGAESQSETGEPHAIEGPTEPDNVQGITWCMAMSLDEGSHRVIDKPGSYERWRAYKPDFWPGPLLGFDVLHAHTGKHVKLPLFADDWYALFPYRQIVDPSIYASPASHPQPPPSISGQSGRPLPGFGRETEGWGSSATIVNWPQNDYFLETILDVGYGFEFGMEVALANNKVAAERLLDAKELSWCLLYWLQTEALRHDGGVGYPGLYLRPDLSGTPDGFAKTAYIRESRRIKARFTILEQHVSTECNPGLDRAPSFRDSVGIGAYRIDLHPSSNGKNTIDCSTLPFEIPMGALIPERMSNLLPACKNLGVTHITNGCYRLHPVEWNIGEAAGLLAAYAIASRTEIAEVYEDEGMREDYRRLLTAHGIATKWPELGAL